jgi:hypothetical protein
MKAIRLRLILTHINNLARYALHIRTISSRILPGNATSAQLTFPTIAPSLAGEKRVSAPA